MRMVMKYHEEEWPVIALFHSHDSYEIGSEVSWIAVYSLQVAMTRLHLSYFLYPVFR